MERTKAGRHLLRGMEPRSLEPKGSMHGHALSVGKVAAAGFGNVTHSLRGKIMDKKTINGWLRKCFEVKFGEYTTSSY